MPRLALRPIKADMEKIIREAIKSARATAQKLEDDCPFSLSNTPLEDTAHALIHALNDAAQEAESALNPHIR